MSETSTQEDAAEMDSSADRDRRRRRVRRWIAFLLIVGLLAGAIFFVRSRRPSTQDAAPPPPKTATIATKNITNDVTFDGAIGYVAAQPLVTHSSGRVTMIADEGAKIALGNIVFQIDEVPTVVFYGDLPEWRDLSGGSEPGPDIAQLEQSLVSLGFDPDGQIVVDDTFTDATTLAVQRWQKQLGQPQTGIVTLGAVIYEPTGVTVGRHKSSVGASITTGATVAETQGAGLVMTFTIKADNKALIAIGQTVDVTMPDRTLAKGQISAIGTAIDPLTGTTSTVGSGTVTAKPGSAPVPDQAPIKVRVTQTVATNVTVVSATALTSYVDGGFSVKVIKADGKTVVVPVTLGVSGGGYVQVSGDGVAPGVDVVIPSDD